MVTPTIAAPGRNYWQVAAEAEGRDYSEWFFAAMHCLCG